MDHIGMDAGMVNSHVCELTEAGEVVERQVRTERRRLQDVFGSRPTARILIEASTESEWIACCLEDLGHEVIVADPNYAPMYRAAKPAHQDGPSGRARAGGRVSPRCVSAGAPDVTAATRRARGRGYSRAIGPHADSMDCPHPDPPAARWAPPRTRARGALWDARDRCPGAPAARLSNCASTGTPHPTERADRRVGPAGEHVCSRG